MATPEHATDDAGTIRPRKAIALLLAMALAALVLIAVTARVAARGVAAMTAAAAVPSGPLIVPAPAVAAGLPRRYRPLTNPRTLAETAQFRNEFIALYPGQAGPYASGLYLEPGRIDIVTGTASWIMYLGVNASSGLGAPAATVSRLVTAMTGRSGRSWPVSAGPGGGAARCGIATIGGAQASVCAWASGRVAAALMSPARDITVKELEAVLPVMRASLQSSG